MARRYFHTKQSLEQISDQDAPPDDTGTLLELMGNIANRIKNIAGTSSWRELPAATLAELRTHIDHRNNPHVVTAAQVGAPPTARAISTTAPLTGGGSLAANRVLSISAATQSAAGSMSATDKAKLDGLDAASFAPSSHVGSGGSAHTEATQLLAGFMSAADKARLDKGDAAKASFASISDYGASPLSNPTDNALAIQSALDDGIDKPGYAVLVPEGQYLIDNPVYIPSEVTLLLYGDLRNVSTTGTITSTVVGMGTYSIHYAELLDLYECGPVAEGSENVTLDASTKDAALADLSVGDTVYVRSRSYCVTVGNIPSYAGLTKITSIDSSTGIVGLRHAFDEDVAEVRIAKADRPDLVGGVELGSDRNAPYMYACYRGAIIGPGRLISDNYHVMARGGQLECVINVGSIIGYGGFNMNLLCYGTYYATSIHARRKVQDIAMCSNNSSFGARSVFCTYSEPNNNALLTFGENSRKNTALYGTLNATSYSDTGGVIRFSTGVRDNHYIVDTVIAPYAAASAINIDNAAQTVSGDEVQHPTQDNSVTINRASFGGSSRYIYARNSGGQNRRNRVLRGDFQGSVSTNAILLEGEDHYIDSSVRCRSGNLSLTSSTLRLQCDGAFFANGVSYSGTSASMHSLRNVRSESQGRAKAAFKSGQPGAINSTVVNNPVNQLVFPADTLRAGDEIYVEVNGRVGGTAGTKKIQMRDEAGIVYDIDFAAAETGAFQATSNITVFTLGVLRGSTLKFKGTSFDVQTYEKSGLDLASGKTLTLEAWVGVSTDTISIYSYKMGLRRAGEDVL